MPDQLLCRWLVAGTVLFGAGTCAFSAPEDNKWQLREEAISILKEYENVFAISGVIRFSYQGLDYPEDSFFEVQISLMAPYFARIFSAHGNRTFPIEDDPSQRLTVLVDERQLSLNVFNRTFRSITVKEEPHLIDDLQTDLRWFAIVTGIWPLESYPLRGSGRQLVTFSEIAESNDYELILPATASDSVALRGSGGDQIWFDMSRRAVVGREIVWTDGSPKRTRVEFMELEEVTPRIWLPKQIVLSEVSVNDGSRTKQEDIMRRSITADDFAVNEQVDIGQFSFALPPGAVWQPSGNDSREMAQVLAGGVDHCERIAEWIQTYSIVDQPKSRPDMKWCLIVGGGLGWLAVVCRKKLSSLS